MAILKMPGLDRPGLEEEEHESSCISSLSQEFGSTTKGASACHLTYYKAMRLLIS